jgi:hypothetical protein
VLGFFRSKPTCPLDADQQQWLDGRFRWLGQQLGEDAPRKCQVVLPTPDFFPDRYDGRPEDARVMLDRVARYMNVDPSCVDFTVYDQARQPRTLGFGRASNAAGMYVCGEADASGNRPRPTIGIDAAQLADPMSLVATIAHELGHEILLGQGRVSRDANDHEPLTDLLTVFLGLGIFTANSTIRDRGWSSGTWTGWETKRLGYLDQRMFGYALARFAWARGETGPPWIKHVRPDVRSPLKQGLRFLAQTDGQRL